jgi:hypothetical protein
MITKMQGRSNCHSEKIAETATSPLFYGGRKKPEIYPAIIPSLGMEKN